MNAKSGLLRNGRSVLYDISESAMIQYKRLQEISRIDDARRRAIYETIELTPSQRRQIDELYIGVYGEKIPYKWHRYYTAFTGNFDARYFPELLYIPEFERYCNIYPEFVKAFTDKNLLPYVAKEAGVEMPHTFISSTRGLIRNGENNIIQPNVALSWLSNAGEVFIKPSINTGSGNGCRLVCIEHGKDQISGDSAIDILNDIGNDYVIQKKIICSRNIRALHEESCNTFRVVTYRWKNTIRHMPVIMRIGRNSNPIDNAHAGGIFIGVDSKGRLKKTAFTEFKEEFTKHPNSKISFEGYHINGFEKVIDAAIRMHIMLPQLGVVHWDFTINENGDPVLIEGNTRGGGIWLLEIAHGVGPFGKNTKEVLHWMHEMKKRKPSQREEIAFGNI